MFEKFFTLVDNGLRTAEDVYVDEKLTTCTKVYKNSK